MFIHSDLAAYVLATIIYGESGFRLITEDTGRCLAKLVWIFFSYPDGIIHEKCVMDAIYFEELILCDCQTRNDIFCIIIIYSKL